MFATRFQKFAYKYFAKPFFFKLDPEQVHDRICRLGQKLGDSSICRAVTKWLFAFEHPMLEQKILNISFRNPVGLTAGFDKNAEMTQIMPSVGFGFEIVGSISGMPCKGNPAPRLWRLPKSKGLVVYYGLKNDGAEVIASRLQKKSFKIPLGISVVKANSKEVVSVEAGIEDYKKAMNTMKDVGDFFVINISCPNVFGGEPFGDPDRLDALLTELDQIETSKPIFLKIAVDISPSELDGLVEVAGRHRVHGFIISNLTKKKDRSTIDQSELSEEQKGGISGRPTFKPSNKLISHLYKTTGDRYVIIGVGGIFSAEDAYEKIIRGASLVQLATGMIFNGPQLIGEINKGLVRLLKKDGFDSVSDAVGSKFL